MPLQSPDPWSQGIMAASSVASAAVKQAGGSEAHGSQTSSFDNSAWSVNIGPGAQQTTNKTDLPTTAQALGAAAASGASLLSSPVFIIGIGIAAFLYMKHK